MATEKAEEEIDNLLDAMIDEIRVDADSWAAEVKAGDWVDCSEDGYYLSGPRFKTKDKLYQVREVDIRKDANGVVYSRTVVVTGDYMDPASKRHEKVWLGCSRLVVRDREVVWESSLTRRISESLKVVMTTFTEEELASWHELVRYPNLVREKLKTMTPEQFNEWLCGYSRMD
jgi:hypothetical protein